VVKAAKNMKVKVIIESSILSYEEKVIACLLAELGGAFFVKSSTGFASGGATVEDIALMKKVVSPKMQIKASGGIKNYATALKMIEAGADRLGCSASVFIVSNSS
jgi:deoxyribose-phosphate aldolase